MIIKEYLDDFISEVKGKNLSSDKITKIKIKLCKKHNIKEIPTNINLFLSIPQSVSFLMPEIKTKPVRTKSGVSVVAIMSKPSVCPHGKCNICPGGVDSEFGTVPQSYTGKEPATRRAIRNSFDSYLQVMNRLEQYIVSGHSIDKIELIIMGGTFPASHFNYQKSFIKGAFKALNDFSDYFFNDNIIDLKKFKSFFELPGDINDLSRGKKIKKKLLELKKKNNQKNLFFEQNKNELSNVRCVSLVFETRPDFAKLSHCNKMLILGVTKVELGVQSPYDDVLDSINRGHSVNDTKESTKILKDLGFKINYHLMPGLPNVNKKKDLEGLKLIFKDSSFRPDMLKIYPCMVLKGTKLYDEWQKGKFNPLSTKEATELISEFKEYVPKYVRIMRVQRDIPTFMTESGVDKTNLRQYIHEFMKKKGIRCNCIRCREIGRNENIILKEYEIKVLEYNASEGKEFFISIENNNVLFGFLRLRFPSSYLREEINLNSALIRELHVYGDTVPIGKKGCYQHKGMGKKLLSYAEKIAKDNKKDKVIVISGIGVREYYRKLGYSLEGFYMVKYI
jgi:elongator complex protein 3